MKSELIENLIRNLDDEGKEFVILGDFNYDLLNQSATVHTILVNS